MISRRSILLLIAAVLLTVPLVKEARGRDLPCVRELHVLGGTPSSTPKLLYVSARDAAGMGHLQRVQDDAEGLPGCKVTGSDLGMYVLKLSAGLCWFGAVASIVHDLSSWKRSRRRGRRRRRRSSRESTPATNTVERRAEDV